MANTSSAKKAIRVTKRRDVINLRKKRDYKEAKKLVQKAVLEKDAKKVKELLPKAYKEIDKAAKMNIIHKNAAARYKSQLSKSTKGL
jgi:small subunit ribosomal protein S20